ncbi:hypothetical protein [Bhargavaea ginsengi]|uniref:hypothetical protein n=1 Tax=Bhargavaea ginsengi TaxID=426757 RepID=UPI001160093A|nr:hypothetical protein [Bhargavaea ginsengi]MCM3089204.1 hypothetical protein [Bhargavaea ginsengi]
MKRISGFMGALLVGCLLIISPVSANSQSTSGNVGTLAAADTINWTVQRSTYSGDAIFLFC